MPRTISSPGFATAFSAATRAAPCRAANSALASGISRFAAHVRAPENRGELHRTIRQPAASELRHAGPGADDGGAGGVLSATHPDRYGIGNWPCTPEMICDATMF